MYTNNAAKSNSVIGWLAAFGYIIGYVLLLFIGQAATWISVILCVVDRQTLKTYGKHIALGWCLLPPVYMYKRAKVLNDGFTKFWVNLITAIIFIILAVYAVVHTTSCMTQALPYFNNNHEIAAQFCQCTLGNSPEECLRNLL